jgi:hypothetical protein
MPETTDGHPEVAIVSFGLERLRHDHFGTFGFPLISFVGSGQHVIVSL